MLLNLSSSNATSLLSSSALALGLNADEVNPELAGARKGIVRTSLSPFLLKHSSRVLLS